MPRKSRGDTTTVLLTNVDAEFELETNGDRVTLAFLTDFGVSLRAVLSRADARKLGEALAEHADDPDEDDPDDDD
jgi:hypothetical protein